VHVRAQTLAGAGWAPAPLAAPDGRGFVAYPFPAGRPLAPDELDVDLLRVMARYCAARIRLFPATPDGAALAEMARANVACGAGVDLPCDWRLPCEHPVIPDARMLPHEWLRTGGGALLKVDGAADGDDHLYPGPVDIAWDLAGAVIEWNLDDGARAALIAAYREAAGEDPTSRLAAHELAYAALRAAVCAMAAHGAGEEEAARLQSAAAHYRRALCARLRG
jgi:hypothetical protein